jgi:hypothetical protein
MGLTNRVSRMFLEAAQPPRAQPFKSASICVHLRLVFLFVSIHGLIGVHSRLKMLGICSATDLNANTERLGNLVAVPPCVQPISPRIALSNWWIVSSFGCLRSLDLGNGGSANP